MSTTQAAVPQIGPSPAAQEHAPQIMVMWSIMTLVTASAAILTRYCREIPATSIGFWRVMGAGIILLPWFIARAIRVRPRPLVSRGALLTGLFFGVHFATWAWALLNAKLAYAGLFIAMQPAVTPILGGLINRDRLNRRELLGTALACVGMVLIFSGQILSDRGDIAGSMVALFSMVCCAVYLVLGRRFRSREHVTLFTVPVYLSAAATQAVVVYLGAAVTTAVPALAMSGGIYVPHSTQGLCALAGLILFPTVGGHTLAMYLLRHTKAHTIALSIPVQFVLIAIAGAVLFGEFPKSKWWFYCGAATVMTGVVSAILAANAGRGAKT